MIKQLFLAIGISIFFNACSVLGIGDVSESTCDGHNCFKEAGVCTDTITIYTHRKDLKNRRTKDHWFSVDEDPYEGERGKREDFTRINNEDLYDDDEDEHYYK